MELVEAVCKFLDVQTGRTYDLCRSGDISHWPGIGWRYDSHWSAVVVMVVLRFAEMLWN